MRDREKGSDSLLGLVSIWKYTVNDGDIQSAGNNPTIARLSQNILTQSNEREEHRPIRVTEQTRHACQRQDALPRVGLPESSTYLLRSGYRLGEILPKRSCPGQTSVPRFLDVCLEISSACVFWYHEFKAADHTTFFNAKLSMETKRRR